MAPPKREGRERAKPERGDKRWKEGRRACRAISTLEMARVKKPECVGKGLLLCRLSRPPNAWVKAFFRLGSLSALSLGDVMRHPPDQTKVIRMGKELEYKHQTKVILHTGGPATSGRPTGGRMRPRGGTTTPRLPRMGSRMELGPAENNHERRRGSPGMIPEGHAITRQSGVGMGESPKTGAGWEQMAEVAHVATRTGQNSRYLA